MRLDELKKFPLWNPVEKTKKAQRCALSMDTGKKKQEEFKNIIYLYFAYICSDWCK